MAIPLKKSSKTKVGVTVPAVSVIAFNFPDSEVAYGNELFTVEAQGEIAEARHGN